MNKMLKAWLAYNWHWLLATLIFPSGILAIAIITKFEFKWAYEALGLTLLVVAAALMLISLHRFRVGKALPLAQAHEFARPIFVLMILFTAAATCGNLYFMVFKLARYLRNDSNHCAHIWNPISDSESEGESTGKKRPWLFDFSNENLTELLLSVGYRLLAATTLPLACFYIVQRSKVDSSAKFEQITASILNFIFAFLFLKSLSLEAYFMIKAIFTWEHCTDENMNENSNWLHNILPKLCPKGNGCNLKEAGLTEQEQAWLIVTFYFMRDFNMTIFTELLPVLLVCHLSISGKAAKMARKATAKSVQNFVVSVFVGPFEEAQPSLKLSMPTFGQSPNLIIFLCAALTLTSILAPHATFFLLLKLSRHGDGTVVDLVDYACLLLSSVCALALFSLLFNWVRKIPRSMQDFRLKAILMADQFLMMGSLGFMVVTKIGYLASLSVYFALNPENVRLALDAILWSSIMNLLYMLVAPVAFLLSTLSLGVLAALPDQRLKEARHLIVPISFTAAIFNAAYFAQNYFRLDQRRGILLGLVKERESDANIELLATIGTFSTIGAFLFHLTSALAWMDIFYRYIQMGLFNLTGKKW